MARSGVKKVENIDERFHPDLIKAAKIRKVYEYWQGKHRGANMPQPDDIDILDLNFAIGSISFIDVVDQSPRFQIRMIGSHVVERHGQDTTGCFVDEIKYEDTRTMLLSSYGIVHAQREPLWLERRICNEHHVYVYECLILPLTDDTGQIVQLMSVLDWPDARLGKSALDSQTSA